MANWGKGFEAHLIVDQIESSKTLSEDGRVSFDGFAHQENLAALTTMIELDANIVEPDQSAIISKAVTNAAKKGPLSCKTVLKEVSIVEKEYLARPLQAFRVYSEISLRAPRRIVRVIDRSRITVGWRPDKRHQNARGTIRASAPVVRRFVPVSTMVQARSVAEAASRAIDHFDTLRGIWNFYLNQHTRIRTSWGDTRKPVNKILAGPIHTIHHPSGDLASNSWWQDSNFTQSLEGASEPRLDRMLEYELWLRGVLKRCPLKSVVSDAFIRYARALDSSDWNYAFLQLWSIIEHLTGARADESHQDTVRRAAFTFRDVAYARQFLTHLRVVRNRAVHLGRDAHNSETIMFQAKRVVEGLLNFHLRLSGRFETMKEAAEFMVQPTDPVEVAKRIKRLQELQAFLKH